MSKAKRAPMGRPRQSGSVRGSAAVAGCLDGEAHQVVMALKPDVQERAMAHAKQLVALNAAPFTGLKNGRNERGGAGRSAGSGRIGHRRLLSLVRKPPSRFWYRTVARQKSDQRPTFGDEFRV